jgi:hypothetical protein
MGSQRYISNELTHFIGRSLNDEEAQYQLLLKIIRDGWLTHPPHDPTKPLDEHFDAAKLISADGLAVRGIVCFCDIPTTDYKLHISKYSSFGLSFAKSYLVKKGASPVYYIASDSLVFGGFVIHKPSALESELLKAVAANELPRSLYFDAMGMSLVNIISAFLYMMGDRKGVNAPSNWSQEELEINMKISVKNVFGINDSDYDIIARLLEGKKEPTRVFKGFCQFVFFHLLGFVKAFDSRLPEEDVNNYYMEREWRVLGNVQFALADIERVIFPRAYAERFRRDIPDYMGQIQFADAD